MKSFFSFLLLIGYFSMNAGWAGVPETRTAEFVDPYLRVVNDCRTDFEAKVAFLGSVQYRNPQPGKSILIAGATVTVKSQSGEILDLAQSSSVGLSYGTFTLFIPCSMASEALVLEITGAQNEFVAKAESFKIQNELIRFYID